MMKRRIFLAWLTLGVMIRAFFSRHAPSYSQNETESDLQFHPVGTLDELKTQGFLLNEDLEIGAVLVRLAEDGSLIAVDPTCTHAGCLVEWDEENNILLCPCHGSKFTQTGTLIEGLASFDLTNYQVKTEGEVVSVAISGS
jgi:cytochrome b6-f complex iron-sulfur subunit